MAFDKKFGSNGTGFNANGIAAVETAVLSNSYILIDEQGNQIGDKTYGEITKLNDNNYGFAHNIDGYAIINGNGEFLSEHIYEYTSEFNNSNLAMVKTENKNKWHLINNEGKEINNNTYKLSPVYYGGFLFCAACAAEILFKGSHRACNHL